MKDNMSFARWLVLIVAFEVGLMVAGVLFSPWEIDPHAENLIAIVSAPGNVALGYLLRGSEKGDKTE